jgi:oxaloacetate decarboxylase
MAFRKRREALRSILTGSALVRPGSVYDATSIRIAEDLGFELGMFGGSVASLAVLGDPDIALITLTELAEQMRRMSRAATLPVLVDADHGYGNAMNVRRTVREFARAGAACILIEDQVWPKKCGHYGGGRQVIARDEARMKIRAAVEARGDGDILILARTDARSAIGFDEAMARCRDFQEEGADIVFAEALQTEEELRQFAGGFTASTWANMMPKTPVASRAALQAMGFKVVTYNVLLPAAIKAMQSALAALVADDPQSGPPLASFEEVTSLVGLPEYAALEERYRLPS